jgi:hypothetical protein
MLPVRHKSEARRSQRSSNSMEMGVVISDFQKEVPLGPGIGRQASADVRSSKGAVGAVGRWAPFNSAEGTQSRDPLCASL